MESARRQEIRRALVNGGAEVIALAGGPFIAQSTPDLAIFKSGRGGLLEVKDRGKKLRVAQARRIIRYNERGVPAWWATTKFEALVFWHAVVNDRWDYQKAVEDMKEELNGRI